MDIDRKMEAVDAKLAGVEDTAVVMERVMTLISECKEGIETDFNEKNEKLDTRIQKIYTDELWYDHQFGPNSKGPNGEDPEFPKMRDYIIKHLDFHREKQGKLISIQRSDHNETDKQMKKIRKEINEGINKSL